MKNRNFLFFVFFFLFFGLLISPVNAALINSSNGSVTMEVPGGSVNTDLDSGTGITVTFTSPTTTTTTTTTTGGGVTETTIKDLTIIDKLLKSITAEDLGLTGELTADDVEVVQYGSSKTTSTLPKPNVIDKALAEATDEIAIQALNAFKKALESGGAYETTVTTTLTVYKVKAKETGTVVYRSMITLSVTATYQDMEDVEIIEVISKDIASDVSELIFPGEQPTILQEDPIVQWTFDKVNKGEIKQVSYVVKRSLTEIDSISLSSTKTKVITEEEVLPIEEEGVEPSIPEKIVEGIKSNWISVFIILLIIVGLYYYIKKK